MNVVIQVKDSEYAYVTCINATSGIVEERFRTPLSAVQSLPRESWDNPLEPDMPITVSSFGEGYHRGHIISAEPISTEIELGDRVVLSPDYLASLPEDTQAMFANRVDTAYWDVVAVTADLLKNTCVAKIQYPYRKYYFRDVPFKYLTKVEMEQS